MDYKKKAKIEKTIYMILLMCGFAVIGGCIGVFLLTFEKKLGRQLSGKQFILVLVAAMIIIMLAYYINICLHETGHMIFGLLSGYRFNSLRFGKLMLIKKDGKLKFTLYDLPGTAGQCIMTAPDCDAGNMPVVLYNIGGLIANLIVLAVGLGVYIIYKTSDPVIGIIGFIFALTSLVLFITNAAPFSQIGTDGANTIILCKDKNARVAFRNTLETVKYLSEGYAIWEMPKQIFEFDKNISMDNPLVTGQAINYYNYLSGTKQFAEAKEMAEYILENARSINTIHESVLLGDLVFMETVINRNIEAAKEIFKKNEKSIKTMATFISIQRVLYTYYTLVEPDEKNAAKYAKSFESSLKHYPYPKDAELEKEQFDMVKEILAEV